MHQSAGSSGSSVAIRVIPLGEVD